MSSSTAESSFCTLGAMMSMTSNNFISLSGSMPKDMPKDHASGAATVDAPTPKPPINLKTEKIYGSVARPDPVAETK